MFETPFLLFTATGSSLNSELNLLQGGFYGALAVLGLYNLFLYGFTRSRSYLYYVGFIASFLFYQLVHNGTALHYFWPNNLQLNSYVYPLFFTLNTLAISYFVPSFLNLSEHRSNVFRVFRGYSALVLVSMLAFPILSIKIIEPLYNSLNILIILSAIIAGLYCWVQGNKSARFFTVAWVCYLLGLLFANIGPAFTYPSGALICIILLGVGLADRLTKKQSQVLVAYDTLLEQQQGNVAQLHEYEDFYENSLDGKFQLDNEGYFVKSNSAWREILGYPNEQFFNEDNPQIDSLFADPKQRRLFWRKLKENGQIRTFIAVFLDPSSNEKIYVSLTIRQSNSDHYAWFGSGQDVTDNYLKEQALIQLQQEKIQSLRQLVIGITDEMSQPLEKINAAANYLQINEDLTKEEANIQLTKGSTLVKQSYERLQQLNRLMHTAVINQEKYNLEPIRIRDWLADWQEQMQHRFEHIELKIAVHSYLVEWVTYPDALQIILEQLIENSCQHNGDLYDAGELKINLQLRERGEFLELHYQDNGQGISPQQRDEVFLPFYTLQKGSSQGLGLYQSYNLLTELMQGVVEWPEAEEGFYLLVRFNMPMPGNVS